MASFFYAFGCSIVHLGLFIGANCVKRANFEKARNLDIDY